MTDKKTDDKTELVKPVRLDLADLPKDTQGALTGIRQPLIKVVNYCRQYPAKLEVLRKTLGIVYKYVVEYQKYETELAKQKKDLETKQQETNTKQNKEKGE